MRALFKRFDVRVSLIYCLFASLWIIVSDTLVAGNPGLPGNLNTLKGLGFVAVTTVLLYALLHRELKLRQVKEAALEAEIQATQQYQQELQDSEAKLRLFIEHAPAALAMFDREMCYLVASRRWMTDYQLGDREILGRSHYDIFPEISDRWKAAHQLGLAGQVQRADEDEFRRDDGSVQWQRWEVHPWYSAPEVIGGIVIFSEDITARKQAEMALRERDEHIRYQANLIESVSVAIISTDMQFIIRSWNRAAEELFGWKAEEVIGKLLTDIVPTHYPENNGETILAQFQRDGLWKGEVIQYHRDGTPIDILSSVSVAFDSSGTPVGYVGINRDIRERKRTEQALQHVNQRLTVLRQIDRDIIQARSPEAITETVLRHVRQLIACERSSVTLLDEATATAVIFALDSDSPSSIQTQMRVPLIRNRRLEILETGQILLIPDLQQLTGTLSEFAHKAIQDGIRASLSAPLLVQGKLIGHLSLASTTPGFFTPDHSEIAGEIANQLAIAFHNTRLLQAVQTSNRQLQTLSARLVEAQEVERGHIARELHDEVGQTLTALSLMLDMQARQSRSQPDAVDLTEAQALVSELMQRIRELSLDLRPSMLDDLGLIATLVWYFRRYEQQTRIVIDFKYSDVDQRFSPVIELTLYRIIQEALTNIARHAQVDRAAVRLWAMPDAIHAQIEDAGVGFDLEAAELTIRTGGLLGLRERAQIAGGECKIESSTGAGTTISVSIPLQPAGEGRARHDNDHSGR